MGLVTVVHITAAALASFIVNFFLYDARIFGTTWMRELMLTPEMVERGKKRMLPNFLIAFIGNVLLASVLFVLLSRLAVQSLAGSIAFSSMLWVGLTAVPMLGMVLWEQRSFRYYGIVAGSWLISFIVIAIVLSL